MDFKFLTDKFKNKRKKKNLTSEFHFIQYLVTVIFILHETKLYILVNSTKIKQEL
jgi:hypothetical protein